MAARKGKRFVWCINFKNYLKYLSSAIAEECGRLEKEWARKRAKGHANLQMKKKGERRLTESKTSFVELLSLRHSLCSALLLVRNVKLIVELQSKAQCIQWVAASQ